MENEIDWENDPILNSELDERIRLFLQTSNEELPEIKGLFDEQSVSSISTPSEFSVNTPSSTATTTDHKQLPTVSSIEQERSLSQTAEATVQTTPSVAESATFSAEKVLATLTAQTSVGSGVKRQALRWDPPAEKRVKYETKLVRYQAKKQSYFERFLSMKTKLRKLKIPNSLPPDAETIKLFDEVILVINSSKSSFHM